MSFKKMLYIAIIITLISSCKSQKSVTQNNDLLQLQTMMSGSYDSNQQAKEDSSYYDISLEMYPIWKSKGEHWLYVEQAVSSMKDKPYRQRLYKIERIAKDQYVSKVYSFNNPDDFIGKWNDPKFFDQFDESIIKEREGCGVFLNKKNNYYEGSTSEKNCKSTLRGASYATSKVTIKNDRIESWDQGFDDKDVQVWGATKGGYIFLKK